MKSPLRVRCSAIVSFCIKQTFDPAYQAVYQTDNCESVSSAVSLLYNDKNIFVCSLAYGLPLQLRM